MRVSEKLSRFGTWLKTNRWAILWIGLSIIPISQGILVVGSSNCKSFAVDTSLRHAEVSCAHEGVNSFDVWSHKVTSLTYEGYPRADFPFDPSPKKRRVHAYPPWHVIFMWFIGWFPLQTWIAIFYTILGGMLIVGGRFLHKRLEGVNNKTVCWALLGSGLLYPLVTLFIYGNYGLLLAFFVGIFCLALEKQRIALAGILWAIIMIKPQIGLLFFWPLFFNRRYLTIGVAMMLCCAATGLLAFVYKCSPITLILQIPQIGAPYTYLSIPAEIGKFFFGSTTFGMNVWAGMWFLLCGGLSYFYRQMPCWWMKILPVTIVFSAWTYSQPHDGLVAWPFFLLLALIVSSNGLTASALTKVILCYVVLLNGMAMWDNITAHLAIWDPSGYRWIYRLMQAGCQALSVVILILFYWTMKKQNFDDSWLGARALNH